MQGVEVVTSAWKQWGLQALVMFSFMLQVMLLVLAEFRRRTDSGVLRFFIWSAYMLADATAIYVLGHISVTSTSPEQELTTFWAPFLLLHLGGQDNITAYAIEDNQLWLRHLQTFIVQVAAAAYILYDYKSPSMVGRWRSMLWPATILMFAVGFLKYGERVWALKCAGTSLSSSNYRCLDRIQAVGLGLSSPASHQGRDTEAFLLKAHVLLDAPMDLLKGPSAFLDAHYGTLAIPAEDLYKVAEMQISLMHDVLYTKAEVMHTWYGLCIHMVSALGTLAALLLFHLLAKIQKGRYSRVDITVTYVLLVGAVIMEITSTLRAMFSGWTCVLLHRRAEAEERNIWHYLYWIVSSLRRLIHAADWGGYWSGSMGQHNLLQLCARSQASKCSMIARWMGVEDPWNTMVYSSSIPVPPRIKELVLNRVLESESVLDSSSPSHIRNSRGRAVLESRGLYDGLLAWSIDIELDESIVVWHIVTDLYLCWFKKQAKSSGRQDDTELLDLAKVIEAIEALSNYMLFLLASRPYMLPPPASRNAYVHVCYSLTSTGECRTPEDLANLVHLSGHELNTRFKVEGDDTTLTGNASESSRYKKILDKGSQLGAKLIDEKIEGLGTTEMFDLISQVWVEMLCYISYRCSAHSHANQLSNGGELITVAAFLIEHIRRRTSLLEG